MNSQQAINLLKDLEQRLDAYYGLNDEAKAAFRMAITALELFGNSEQLPSAQPDRMKLVQQTVNTIMSTSRSYSIRDKAFRNAARFVQCAIDGEAPDFEQIPEGDEMPSAQPEIIRCKDCKNSEHWYRDRRRCFLWSEDGVSVFDDGFCNYAERRQDD